MDGKLLVQVMAGLSLVGCSFDPAGVPLDGGSGGGPDAMRLDDGGLAPDAAPDAAPCPGETHLVLTVNGENVPDPTDDTFRIDVLVGDLITLSAAGSCTTEGGITYEWEFDPDPGTAAGGLGSDTIDFYPDQVLDYTVSIRVQGASGGPEEADIHIRAHGWQPIEATAGGNDVDNIKDLEVSDSDLWIAANSGAYRLPLTGAQDTLFALNSELEGTILSGNLTAVYYDRPNSQLWYGSNDTLAFVWRIDISSPAPFPAATININGSDALNGSAKVRDIGPSPLGLAVATDQGLTETPDGATFDGDLEPNGDRNVRSVATGDGRHWAGGRLLYDLDGGGNLLPFGGTDTDDNKIVALAVDQNNDDLWVGSDDRGVARVNNANGIPRGVYDDGNSGLATKKIRHLRVETGRYIGDVWAATDQGVARYIRGRDTWLTMGDAHGLNGNLNVEAIAIDEADGRRVIYAGTSSGVVHLRVP